MNTKEKQESSFLNKLFTGISLIYLLLGGLLIAVPKMRMEYICYGISILLVVLGIIFIVKYFLTESFKNLNQYGFSIGVFLVMIGICTLVRNRQMAENFPVYIGVCILLTAIIKLQNAMDLKALKDRAWSVICGVSIVIMACAVMIIINPFSNSSYETTLTYFSLLFDGVISIFSYHYLAFRLKRTEKRRVAEQKEVRGKPKAESEPEPEPEKEIPDSLRGMEEQGQEPETESGED